MNFAEEKEKTQAREKKDQQWWLILYTFQDRDGFMPAHQYNQHSTVNSCITFTCDLEEKRGNEK